MWYALYPFIGLATLFNVVVLVLVSIKLSRRKAVSGGQGRKRGLVFLLRFVAIFSTLLGISWVIGGVMIATGYTLALQIIFVVLVPLQGIFLFLFFCVSNADIRARWRALFSACLPCVKPPVSRKPHLETGDTSSKLTMSRLKKQSTMKTEDTSVGDNGDSYRATPVSEPPKTFITE